MAATIGAFDCDTHIYEPRDAMTRYLPREYLERSIRPIRNAAGEDVVLAGSRIANFDSEHGTGFDLCYRPGSLHQMLREMASGNPTGSYDPEPMRPESIEREPRMKLLDRQGVRAACYFPAH